jgi:hypothetical protein
VVRPTGKVQFTRQRGLSNEAVARRLRLGELQARPGYGSTPRRHGERRHVVRNAPTTTKTATATTSARAWRALVYCAHGGLAARRRTRQSCGRGRLRLMRAPVAGERRRSVRQAGGEGGARRDWPFESFRRDSADLSRRFSSSTSSLYEHRLRFSHSNSASPSNRSTSATSPADVLVSSSLSIRYTLSYRARHLF